MKLPFTRISLLGMLHGTPGPFLNSVIPRECCIVHSLYHSYEMAFLCSLLGEGGGRGRDNAYVLPRALKLQGEGIAPSPSLSVTAGSPFSAEVVAGGGGVGYFVIF
jgi:hypothetical protein